MQRILIVDDNEDIQEVLGTYVAKEGFEPVVAKDGFEALELTLYAGNREQAEKLAENIRRDPMASCNRIAEALLQEHPEPDTEKYL